MDEKKSPKQRTEFQGLGAWQGSQRYSTRLLNNQFLGE